MHGRSLTLELMLAEGGPSARTDPAYRATEDPLRAWAVAVWNGYPALPLLDRLLRDQDVRLKRAKSPWRAVRGPAGGMLATAWRLG